MTQVKPQTLVCEYEPAKGLTALTMGRCDKTMVYKHIYVSRKRVREELDGEVLQLWNLLVMVISHTSKMIHKKA